MKIRNSQTHNMKDRTSDRFGWNQTGVGLEHSITSTGLVGFGELDKMEVELQNLDCNRLGKRHQAGKTLPAWMCTAGARMCPVLHRAGCLPTLTAQKEALNHLGLEENPGGKTQLEKEKKQVCHGTFPIFNKALQADLRESLQISQVRTEGDYLAELRETKRNTRKWRLRCISLEQKDVSSCSEKFENPSKL